MVNIAISSNNVNISIHRSRTLSLSFSRGYFVKYDSWAIQRSCTIYLSKKFSLFIAFYFAFCFLFVFLLALSFFNELFFNEFFYCLLLKDAALPRMWSCKEYKPKWKKKTYIHKTNSKSSKFITVYDPFTLCSLTALPPALVEATFLAVSASPSTQCSVLTVSWFSALQQESCRTTEDVSLWSSATPWRVPLWSVSQTQTHTQMHVASYNIVYKPTLICERL